MRHVYWIGGGSGAGKSTVARRLATEHDLIPYPTDDAMRDHAGRSTPEDSPLLSDFITMDMDQRWVHRPPDVMLETFHWFQGEGFGLIVQDLRRLARDDERGVLAEGFRLLPHLVKPLLEDRRHAVWLLPTAEFRRAAFESRGSTWQIAGRTSDPERALRNLLERDRMFTERLREETRRLDLPAIDVDITTTEDELTDRVATAFALR